MKMTIVFLNGKMVEVKGELLTAFTPGVLSGVGVFETMRVYDGGIFALEEHLARMSRGLRVLGRTCPHSTKCVRNLLHKVLEVNGLKEARIRLAVWCAVDKLDQQHQEMVIVAHAVSRLSDKVYCKGWAGCVSNIRRNRTRLSHIKSLAYHRFREAYLAAQEHGFDEAILLNDRGKLVEGSRTNIFVVHKGVIQTPAVHCGCLNGITRKIVFKLAQDSGMSCRATVLTAQHVWNADEVFLTNSVIGVMPLTLLDCKEIGNGVAGEITLKMRFQYENLVNVRMHPDSIGYCNKA